jgi:RND superfamily putative drug exporter
MALTTAEREAIVARIETRQAAGPLGRIGLWVLDHARGTAVVWALVVVGLGLFAPQVESALSGAGWQDDGSESVAARQLAQEHFGGNAASALQVVVTGDGSVVTGDGSVVTGRGARVIAAATRILESDPRIADVVVPVPGATVSRDGGTAILLGGARGDTNEMVAAASDLKGRLTALSGHGVQVEVTGSSALWSDFNSSNLSAMLTSELLSWPVTMAILVLAFGTLVAAGLPLLLTLAGLVASAGSLVLITRVVPVSIWAMNFAMMFALALGIDYALFLVVRYRAARRDSDVRKAVATTMDTAGKAILLSGATVLVSLSAVMLVPSPAFRSAAGGIMLAVVFVLGATLTLLPLVLAKLDRRIDRLALPWSGHQQPSSPRFAAWAERLWRRPAVYGGAAIAVLAMLAAPVIGLKTSMPSIQVLPHDATARVGYDLVQHAFGPGAPAALQVVVPADRSAAAERVLARDRGIALALPAQPAADRSGYALIQVLPTTGPTDPALSATLDRLRAALPDGALVGGAAAENLDLAAELDAATPIVIGVVLALGFLLLVFALQAPLVALLGTLTSLLSVGAAFGIARMIFQEGWGAGVLGFTSQGFLDAWAPVFFFAMIFAIAMDYTAFLLSSAKEHYEQTGDPHQAVVGALAHSGRVIFAAGAVMVAVFFTFALSGPLPPKEMGVVLGVAVLVDAFLVRLVLLPVLLRLTGHAAWWAPAWLRRVLPAIRFSHG